MNYDRCEECSKPFTATTGREYIQLIGGGYADVCADCAERIANITQDEE